MGTVDDLFGANISRADLRWANLRRADLSGTDLRGTDLRGADLRRADLSRANIRGAKYDSSTVWPHGFDPEAAGAELVTVEVGR